MQRRDFIFLSFAAAALGGCSTIKKLTGQRNDTILPGQREDILPPDQQTARDPVVTGQKTQQPPVTSAPCDPSTYDCTSQIDQEGTGTTSQ